MQTLFCKTVVTLLIAAFFTIQTWAQEGPMLQNPSINHYRSSQPFSPHQDQVSSPGQRLQFNYALPASNDKKAIASRSRAKDIEQTASTAQWEKLHKPSEGDYLFELAEHNGKLYAASTTGRIYTSSDVGQSWTKIGHFPYYYSNYPHYFTYEPYPHFLTVNDNMIFYKGDYSLDGGVTWGNIFDNSNGQFTGLKKTYSGFIIQGFLPVNNDIYVYTWRDGIIKTSDYGYTWTSVSNGLPHDIYGFVTDIERMMFNNGTLYCSSPTGLYFWNGSSWQTTSTINFYHNKGNDVVSITDMHYMYAETPNGFYFTEDGTTWTSYTDVDFTNVTWKPKRAKRISDTEIFAAGSDMKLHHTTDKGATWSVVELHDTNMYNYTLSICGIGSKILACNTFGLFTSNSPYQQWSLSNTGIEQARFVGMAKVNGKLLTLSPYRGLYESADDGETWQLLDNELKYSSSASMLTVGNDLFVTTYDRGLMKSSDGGHHWALISTTGIDAPKVKPYQQKLFAINSSLYLAQYFSYGTKVYRSSDAAATWSKVFNGYSETVADSMIYVTAISSDGKNVFVATENGYVLESNDNCVTWIKAPATGLPNQVYQGVTYYYSIYDFSYTGNTLYALVGDFPASTLYKLSGDGTTWSKVVIDPSLETVDYQAGQWGNFMRTPQLINNTLLVYVEKGYGPKAYFYSPFLPSRFEHLYYTSKDNGATWQQADVGTAEAYAEASFLFPHKDKIYEGITWVGGGLYRLPMSAFGIDPNVEIYSQKTHGQKNKEVVAHVKTSYFKNILSAQFSVNWDPAVATYVETEGYGLNGMDANSFGASNASSGQLTFSWTAPNLSTQTLSDTSTLFNIRFKLTGNYGAKTPISITAQPLDIELINANFANMELETWPGMITIDSVITVSGKILYTNNEAVQSVTVNLGGGIQQSSITDSNGSYSFVAPAGISYSISPIKINDPNPLNGIDVQDVASVRRHILGIQKFNNAYQTIAADVNENNQVSTLDIDYIQALILGVKDNFPNNKQWTFTPGDYLFSDANNPFPHPGNVKLSKVDGIVTQDFVAMKLGDVNNSRDNSQQNRNASANEVVFVIDAGRIISGILEVPIQVRNFEEIAAYQFTVTWDQEKLEYIETTNEKLDGQFGEIHIHEGSLTTLWDEQNGKSADLSFESNLFKIHFRKKISDASGNDVNITSSKTTIAVYDKNLKPVPYSITRKQEEIGSEFELLQNFPNSFDSKTQIGFSIPQVGEVKLDILDATGRVVLRVQNIYDAGKNFIEWDGKDLSGAKTGAGLYIYRAQYGSMSQAKRMIKN